MLNMIFYFKVQLIQKRELVYWWKYTKT